MVPPLEGFVNVMVPELWVNVLALANVPPMLKLAPAVNVPAALEKLLVIAMVVGAVKLPWVWVKILVTFRVVVEPLTMTPWPAVLLMVSE